MFDRYQDPGQVAFGSGFAMVGLETVSPRGLWAAQSANGGSWGGPIKFPTRPVTSFAEVLDLATDDRVLVAVGFDVIFGGLAGTDEIDPWRPPCGQERQERPL